MTTRCQKHSHEFTVSHTHFLLPLGHTSLHGKYVCGTDVVLRVKLFKKGCTVKCQTFCQYIKHQTYHNDGQLKLWPRRIKNK